MLVRVRLVVIMIFFLLYGCETVKGVARTASNVGYEFGKGMCQTGKGFTQDVKNFVDFIYRLDEKFREKCW